MDVTRRAFVRTLWGGAVGMAAGVWFPLESLGRLVARTTSRRVPADLLSRLRRRTRALDLEALRAPHDLAG